MANEPAIPNDNPAAPGDQPSEGNGTDVEDEESAHNQEDSWVVSYQDAIKHQQDAAKWVLGIFAAIAAVLLAGSQLSSIGELEGPSWLEDVRLSVAIVSGAVGLLAAGVVVWAAVRVLQAGRAALWRLEDEEVAVEERHKWQVWKRPSSDLQFAWRSDILKKYPDKKTRVRKFLEDYNTKWNAYERAPDATPKTTLDEMYRQLEDLRVERKRLLWGLKADQVQQKFKSSVITMFLAGGIAAVAIMAFAWAANPQDTHAEIVADVPGRGFVSLTGDESDRLALFLGESCVESDIEVIILGAANDKSTAYDVVSVPNDRCRIVRFKVGEGAVGTLRGP